MTLEQELTKKVVVLTDKHGMTGKTYCGHCDAIVPEPFYERKRCSNCRYPFSEVLSVCDPLTGRLFEYNPATSNSDLSYFKIFGEVVKRN